MRCYNGAPDNALQALLFSREEATKALEKEIPGATVTYFPMEGGWGVFDKDYRQISPINTDYEVAIGYALRGIG